jgi:hypothetical protein
MEANVRTVITALLSSAANHEAPEPSGPDGQRILFISLKRESGEDGDPLTWAPCKGMGTNDEEKGDAPGENGTFGLFVPFKMMAPLPWKEVMKEPAKKRLDRDELDVMDKTWLERPVNGGLDHDADFGSQRATAELGDVKLPPTQTLLPASSQYTA